MKIKKKGLETVKQHLRPVSVLHKEAFISLKTYRFLEPSPTACCEVERLLLILSSEKHASLSHTSSF